MIMPSLGGEVRGCGSEQQTHLSPIEQWISDTNCTVKARGRHSKKDTIDYTIIQSAKPTNKGPPDESARLVEEHPVFNLVLEGGAKKSQQLPHSEAGVVTSVRSHTLKCGDLHKKEHATQSF